MFLLLKPSDQPFHKDHLLLSMLVLLLESTLHALVVARLDNLRQALLFVALTSMTVFKFMFSLILENITLNALFKLGKSCRCSSDCSCRAPSISSNISAWSVRSRRRRKGRRMGRRRRRWKMGRHHWMRKQRRRKLIRCQGCQCRYVFDAEIVCSFIYLFIYLFMCVCLKLDFSQRGEKRFIDIMPVRRGGGGGPIF